MACEKCPHVVRHGKMAADGKNIAFDNRCGLRMKQDKQVDCNHYPFDSLFDYGTCDIYLDIFKTSVNRNNVVPKSDVQYSEKLASSSITEMEYL